jgi:hypothetical protein
VLLSAQKKRFANRIRICSGRLRSWLSNGEC